MSTITTAAFWLLLPLIVLAGVIGWASESRGARIRRQRREGRTWAWIAERQGCSPRTARRWAAVA